MGSMPDMSRKLQKLFLYGWKRDSLSAVQLGLGGEVGGSD